MYAQLNLWAKIIKRDVLALYLAMRDPRVPWLVKIFAALVAGYALSPIDLIPDFIPVLGYLDDIILLPLGILLVVRMIPAPLMAELRHQAATTLREKRLTNPTAAIVIISIWILGAGALTWLAVDLLTAR
ncbi:MAG: YkvA family protein [Gammaproteobacteria bacterium]